MSSRLTHTNRRDSDGAGCGGALLRSFSFALGLLAIALTAALPAQAAYKGSNGFITYTHRVPGNSGSWSIQSVNPDGSGLATVPVDGGLGAGWSPDGNRLFAARATFDPEKGEGFSSLLVMNADGSGQRTVSDGIAAVRSPSWSPDGNQIAYKNASPTNSASGEIWVMNADGTGRTQVTKDGTAKLDLDWGMTPSGSRIAFFGYLAPAWGLFTVAPDGTNRTRVAAVPAALAFRAFRLDWSPDGTKIVFAAAPLDPARYFCEHGSCNYDHDIYVVDLVASTVTNLTKTVSWGGPYESDPVWSPDGSKIAFAAYTWFWDGAHRQITGTRIYTMSAAGSGLRAISDPEVVGTGDLAVQSYDAAPDWQPCITGLTKSCVSVTPPPPVTPKPACHDGFDNDADGKIDYPADPGCGSSADDDEFNPGVAPPTPPLPACSDGKDNDGDGRVDYPGDPGCASVSDTSEAGSGGSGGGGGNEGSGGKKVATKLLVDSFSALPNVPRAGRTFTMRMRVVTADGDPVRSGKVTGRATIRGKALLVLAHGFRGGAAFFTWRVPVAFRGRVLSASIRLATSEAAVAKSLKAVVR